MTLYRVLLMAVLVLLTTTASAQELRNLPPTPQDFAWQWPLTVEPGEELMLLTLNPDVYARLWRDDLADLVVFNHANQPVPVSPLDAMVLPLGDAAGERARPIEVPLFRIPASTVRAIGDRMRLVVSRREDGRLELRDTTSAEQEEMATSAEWLLDLSSLKTPVRGLLLELQDGATPLVGRVDVFGSHDLTAWTRLAAGQAVVSLREGELKLERRRLEFADTTLPYLRLQRTDTHEGLPLAGARVLPVQVWGRFKAAPLQQFEVTGHPGSGPGVFTYAMEGPFPITRVQVNLAEPNSAANVIIETRARADLPWRERVRAPVFKLDGKRAGIESAPLDLRRVRDRQWRVRTEPAQARAPTLTLGYHPDQFVFLTQGEGPWRLAAGSARSQRANAPLQAVLQTLPNDPEAAWQGNQAHLGRGAELAGGAALAPRPDASGSPTAWQWVLWGLLLAGAFAVVTMVLRLLRQAGA